MATTTHYGAASADIVRCAVCGHMQVERFPSQPELEERYTEVAEGAYLGEEMGQRSTAARALAQIERYRPAKPGRILDLGCWVGFLLAEAQERGWEAWGVEPSRLAAEFARDRLGLNVQRGTVESADLPEGYFDAVVMGDVIEHLPNPGAALDRIRDLLAPQGVLYLALPDAGSAAARVMGARWWSVLQTHVQYFTRPSMARLLVSHGYVVEWIDTAPKAFTVGYYLERFEGYSKPVANAAVATAKATRVANRLIWLDLRDRMAVLARRREA
jgi:SAM-dependent methyltransferase